MFTHQAKLERHKQHIHKRITFKCDQCEYKATQQGYLKRHIQSVHEGVTNIVRDGVSSLMLANTTSALNKNHFGNGPVQILRHVPE